MRKHAVTERATFSILLFISAAFVRLLLPRGAIRGGRGAEKFRASPEKCNYPDIRGQGQSSRFGCRAERSDELIRR